MPNSPAAPSILQFPDHAELAVRMLRSADALHGLSQEEARAVVAHARLMRFRPGQVIVQEGDQANASYMVLMLHGEATVESMVASRTDPVVISVLQPGQLIGEIALLDGGARVASCVASTAVIGAGLSRRALQRMQREEPDVAAKLMYVLGQRMAARLREAARQQRIYAQLVRAMQQEIDVLGQQLQQVMDGAAVRQGRPGSQSEF
jgi:CRP/FNR family cyclic AMP-dependent transcriptional regulator